MLVTNISPVNSETDTTVINTGHLGETHYVSTVPFICNNQLAQLATGHYWTTNNNEIIAVTKEQKRKAYLKEYMATRRKKIMSSEISKTELCKQKDQQILKKTREHQKQAFSTCKQSNSDHIRELNRQAFAKSKRSNPQHVREVNKNAQNRKRSLMSGLNPSDHDFLQPAN